MSEEIKPIECIAQPRDNWNVTELTFAMDQCQCDQHKDYHRIKDFQPLPTTVTAVDAVHGDTLVKDLCGKCKREKVDGKCPACGRPVKYTTDEEMIAKVDTYLATCSDQYTPDEKKWNVKLPKLESFCLMLGIDDDTLVEWRKEHKEFSAACKKIEQKQKESLVDQGLAGNYNPVITKLLLSANHGMTEKTAQDITSKGEKVEGISVSFVKPKE